MTHFDLAVIGTGSGNSVVDSRFADRRVALLEKGTFGGTCLNVGCIPTKMFVYPADLAHDAANAERLGVHATIDKVSWREIRDRIFTRIDPISASGRHWRSEINANITLFEDHARFTGLREIDTGTGVTITADQVVIAAGSRAVLPPIPGLRESFDRDRPRSTAAKLGMPRIHTSDTIMRIDDLPRSLAIIGGGFVAAEFAHIFGSFGSEITVINRSEAMLRAEDHDISARFTEAAGQRWDLRMNTVVDRVEEHETGVRLALTTDDVESTLEADIVLVATGRQANSDGLDLHRTGVEVDEAGLVVVDAHQRTSAEGIWALGDVSNQYQLKHLSNHEARVVRHNLLHPDDLVETDRRFIPSAVFTSPQVASVGITEQQAVERGIRFVTARQSYGDTAYGWAMEDNVSFAKVIADPESGLLLGAHLIGPQASNLIQPLIQAMSFGMNAHRVARGQFWIHPALSEVVENVLLDVETDEPSTQTPG